MPIWLCDMNHEEICYESGNQTCPICNTIQEKDDEIEQLQDDIKTLTDNVDNLNSEVAALEAKEND